jgi:hypothetical protein
MAGQNDLPAGLTVDENPVPNGPGASEAQPMPVAPTGALPPGFTVDATPVGGDTAQPQRSIEEHQASMSAPKSLIQSAQVPNAGAMIKQWFTNVQNDIKYGSDTTGVGTLLRKMGAHGVYMGNPQAVGDIIASLPLGLLKHVGAMEEMTAPGTPMGERHIGRNLGEAFEGAAQAAQIPTMFAAPEASEGVAQGLGDVADEVGQAGRAAMAPIRRIGQAFAAPRNVDRAAAETTAMRAVQPMVQNGLRSMAKSVESVAGFEKGAGEAGTAEPAVQSIRVSLEKTADKFFARSKAAAGELDEAMGVQFQRFQNKIKNINTKLWSLVHTDDEASYTMESNLLEQKATVEAEFEEALDKIKAKGKDFSQMVDNFRYDYKRAQALYDTNYNVLKATKGLRPEGQIPEDIAKDPELIHPGKFADRINNLYDSYFGGSNTNRLEEALGPDLSRKMLTLASKAKVQYQQALDEALQVQARMVGRNKMIRNATIGAGATAVGAPVVSKVAQAVTHLFNPESGSVTPVQ